jgi:hypothetical protein
MVRIGEAVRSGESNWWRMFKRTDSDLYSTFCSIKSFQKRIETHQKCKRCFWIIHSLKYLSICHLKSAMNKAIEVIAMENGHIVDAGMAKI